MRYVERSLCRSGEEDCGTTYVRLRRKVASAAVGMKKVLTSTSTERALNFDSPISRSSTSSRTAGTVTLARSLTSESERSPDTKSNRTKMARKVGFFICTARILSEASSNCKWFHRPSYFCRQTRFPRDEAGATSTHHLAAEAVLRREATSSSAPWARPVLARCR